MPEFLRLLPPPEALALLLSNLPDLQPAAETIDTIHALGRVTAEDIRAPYPLPEFTRATVDGYAVRAADTFGASDRLPAYLCVTGEVPMGAAPSFGLQSGECALIHTGGMLPEGADAVVMLEYTQSVNHGEHNGRGEGGAIEIEVLRAVAVGENVICVGEDVAADQVVIASGTRVRPAEIGGLVALGIVQLRVVIKPKIGILSSGNEVIPPEQRPRPGQVRDINSHSLAVLVVQTGGEPVLYGIVPDKLDAMKQAAARALAECDMLVITAGSSASARDVTAEALRSLGAPGVLVHGVNVRPGKPTILAACNGKAAIGLPGNPVSALVIAQLFVVPLIERLLGLQPRAPRPSVMARLTVNIPSQAGREDWWQVRLTRPSPLSPIPSAKSTGEQGTGEVAWLAEPIFAKSNLIFSLVTADGLVRIPPDATGLSAGESVWVYLI